MTDEAHPARSKRDKNDEIKRNHSTIPVKNGTEQMGAIVAVRDELTHTALLIENRCPEGRAKSIALRKLEEASMWAIKAISHRE